MAEIHALFWDVGGVLLTNGWDRESRRAAAEQFGLDWEDFERRHEGAVADFEAGHLSLEGYLEQTVFYRPPALTMEALKSFIFAQSRPYPEALALLERLARSGRYRMAVLNNESLELNQYRIERFGLHRCFSLFLSSCFLGVRKPDEVIYRMALQITQCSPEECLFIDDRPPNLAPAERCGMATIHYQNLTQLQQELRGHGVAWDEN